LAQILRDLNVPLFLAKHEGCLMFTPEGYEAARAAFPSARSRSFPDKPSSSPQFAETLREFCLDLRPTPAGSPQ
jgi:hypothetical protein